MSSRPAGVVWDGGRIARCLLRGITAADTICNGGDAMTSQSVEARLLSHPFFRSLPEGHRERLLPLAQPVRFTRDQVIFREGEPNSFFYLIVSGSVSLEMGIRRGMLQVQRIGDGAGLGWSAALVGRPKHFQARALTDTEAFAFSGPEVLKLCEQDPEFGFRFMQRLLDVVSARLQATREQLMDMHSPVARQAGV